MSEQTRQLLAQMVIMFGVCGGAWMMLAQPGLIELQELEHEIANEASQASTSQDTVQYIARQASSLRGQLDAITHANMLAHDSSQLYGVIMELAQDHGVKVQSLQPGSLQQRANSGTADDSDDVAVAKRRVSMAVTGAYEQIANFLRAVDDMPHFVRPVSVSLAPKSDGSESFQVHGNLAWDVLSFELTEHLLAIQGGDRESH